MKFKFSKSKLVNRYNYHTLSDLHLNQFKQAIKAYIGGNTLEESFEECELSEILWYDFFTIKDVESGKIIYDGWFFGSDEGSLFHHNTETNANLSFIQGYCHDESSNDDEELTKALQKAKKRASFSNEVNGFHSSEKWDLLAKEYWAKKNS